MITQGPYQNEAIENWAEDGSRLPSFPHADDRVYCSGSWVESLQPELNVPTAPENLITICNESHQMVHLRLS
jgi:hypothetical protein